MNKNPKEIIISSPQIHAKKLAIVKIRSRKKENNRYKFYEKHTSW